MENIKGVRLQPGDDHLSGAIWQAVLNADLVIDAKGNVIKNRWQQYISSDLQKASLENKTTEQ